MGSFAKFRNINRDTMDKSRRLALNEKPVIGITIGDINGIGPEVIIKALADNRMLKLCTPVIYGSTRVLAYYKKQFQIDEFNYSHIKSHENIFFKKINVINCWDDLVEINVGSVTPEAGRCAFLALERACDDLKSGYLDALVTGPINKHNIQNDQFAFAGHTEYLTNYFGAKDSLMFLVSEDIRVGVATGHIPLQDVPKSITSELIIEKVKLMASSLRNDFGILKPKIAILGLNPHAGEEGLLGKEEIEVIKPAIQKCKEEGLLVFGPFPSDGFFGTGHFKKVDGILAMYHDQGLIPFKTLAFDSGINFTAGLPIVRTSPDHGTAYDIAGKNVADEKSMREAIFLACDIVQARSTVGAQAS